MAAETVLVCECGCGQSEHHVGKKGCKHCRDCTRFRAAEEVPAADVAPVPAEELAAEHDRLMNERAGLVLDGADPADLVMPIRPDADPGWSTSTQLRDMTEQLEGAEQQIAALGRERDDALKEVNSLLASNKVLGDDLDLAQTKLASVIEELDGLRRGRTEATERALELAAQLKGARDEIDTLTVQLEHAEQYARDLQGNGDVPTGVDVLLDQADATKVPAIVATSDSIRDLIGQLREQLAEHESREELREELARIEQRATEIRRVLAAAEKPPAPAVPDKTVRDWARKNGFEVDARGRVPAWLRTQYLHANSA